MAHMPELSQNTHANAYPKISLNISDFAEFLIDEDYLEEDKEALMHELWKLVVTFVDLGFGIEATQAIITTQLFSDDLDTNCEFDEEGNEI